MSSSKSSSCRPPRPTLRSIISLFSAILVLVVACATLIITYSFTMDTLRDIGGKHSLALVRTATLATQNYFDTPTEQLRALGKFTLDRSFPSDEPDSTAEEEEPSSWTTMYHHFNQIAFLASDYQYGGFGVLFSDGSGCDSHLISPPETGVLQSVCLRHVASTSTTSTPQRGVDYNNSYSIRQWSVANNSKLRSIFDNDQLRHIRRLVNVKVEGWDAAVGLSGTSKKGLWFPVFLFRFGDRETFALPALYPIFNHSGTMLGFATMTTPLAAISEFLTRHTKSTANTEVFAVDDKGLIIASSHSTPFSSVSHSPRGTIAPPGCTFSPEYLLLGCRRFIRDFPYPPLQAVASDEALVFTKTVQTIRLEIPSGLFYVASAPLNSSFRFFALNLIVCLPEIDITSGMDDARDLAILITTSVFVVAAVLAFVLVYVLLKPLSVVSEAMKATATLRDDRDFQDEDFEEEVYQDNEEMNASTEDNPAAEPPRLRNSSDGAEGPAIRWSSTDEIYNLQRSYVNMSAAIRSFTRYVPRDIVTDLMVTGQLCELKMVVKKCTMLFVDIAGFTTMCERVPPDVLSHMVSEFFDVASRTIMRNGGLIDKFIGDCVMAVWGAPFHVANHEAKGCLTALQLNRATQVEPLYSVFDEAGESLSVRVGVSTGNVLAGNMGSAQRMNYTVIGDAVNLAARLESLNKQFETRCMASEATVRPCISAFVTRLLGKVRVVGKEEAVLVYELIGVQPNLDDAVEAQFNAEDAEEDSAMRELEARARKQQEPQLGSSAGSNASDQHSASSSQASMIRDAHEQRRQQHRRKRTVLLLREACASTVSTSSSLVPSEPLTRWARTYTHAVRQLLFKKDYHDCLRLLRECDFILAERARVPDSAQDDAEPAPALRLSTEEHRIATGADREQSTPLNSSAEHDDHDGGEAIVGSERRSGINNRVANTTNNKSNRPYPSSRAHRTDPTFGGHRAAAMLRLLCEQNLSSAAASTTSSIQHKASREEGGEAGRGGRLSVHSPPLLDVFVMV